MDACMVNLITELNKRGLETLACCCGHGRYDMSIVVSDRDGKYDIISGARIPRLRKYYRRDEAGYYYIPETLESKLSKTD
jgi:hypothetical protein